MVVGRQDLPAARTQCPPVHISQSYYHYLVRLKPSPTFQDIRWRRRFSVRMKFMGLLSHPQTTTRHFFSVYWLVVWRSMSLYPQGPTISFILLLQLSRLWRARPQIKTTRLWPLPDHFWVYSFLTLPSNQLPSNHFTEPCETVSPPQFVAKVLTVYSYRESLRNFTKPTESENHLITGPSITPKM